MLNPDILRKKTFEIISHPDAEKTTLIEKLLLFVGAILEAGAVKNNKIKKRSYKRLLNPNEKEFLDFVFKIHANLS